MTPNIRGSLQKTVNKLPTPRIVMVIITPKDIGSCKEIHTTITILIISTKYIWCWITKHIKWNYSYRYKL